MKLWGNSTKYIKFFKIGIILLLLLFYNLSFYPTGNSITIDGNWSQFGHDINHTGYQPKAGNENISNYELKWHKFVGDGSYGDLIYGEITVADIDFDNEKEIIFGSDNGKLYCLNIYGNLTWEYTVGGGISSTPTLKNLTGDKNLEIIIGYRSGGAMNRAGGISVISHEGKLIWEYITSEDGFDASAAVADITGNGELNIVMGSLDNNIYALSKNGDLIWKYDTGNWIESSALIIDLNNDNKNDIVVGNGNGNMYAITTIEEIIFENIPKLRRIELKPKILWEFKTNQVENIGFVGSPVATDINNDKNLEIIFGASDGKLYCLDNDGKKLWNYSTNNPIYTTPSVADINNDGKIEIIFGSDNLLIALNSNGKFLWQQEFSMRIGSNPSIFDVNGDDYLEITSIDKEWITLGPDVNPKPWINSTNILNYKGEIIHKLKFSEKTFDHVYGVSIEDLEDDGELEILTGTYFGSVYCYGKIDKSSIDNNNGEIDNNENNEDKSNDAIPSFEFIIIFFSIILSVIYRQKLKKVLIK